jgi:hypothetical protein
MAMVTETVMVMVTAMAATEMVTVTDNNEIF